MTSSLFSLNKDKSFFSLTKQRLSENVKILKQQRAGDQSRLKNLNFISLDTYYYYIIRPK